VLSTGTIVGIAIGCLAGLATLISIIVGVIILLKRRSIQSQAQQQQQQTGQTSTITMVPGQQWTPDSYYMPPTDSMDNFNAQPPPIGHLGAQTNFQV